MKKISLLLAIAFVAVACQPDLPPLPSEKPATTGTTGSTAKPATTATTGTTGSNTAGATGSTATTGSTTTGSTTGTTGATAANDPNKPQPGDIPRRIFQLRTLAHTNITAGRKSVDAFVADDDYKVEEGLMWVTDKDLKDEQGMIFVFGDPTVQSFWMRNTLIPLDIVYIDQAGKVLNIVHGKPRDETSLKSSAPAKYALELKDGMAAKLGINPGTKLTISKDLVRRDAAQNQQQPGITIPGQ